MRNGILFFGFALATFWLAFGAVGVWLSETWSILFTWWTPPGLLGALWTMACMLLGLLPQLIILFSFFHFVERYSSPSLIRIVMGFGCGTVAASTLGSVRCERARRREAFFLSFIPCSAQMPVVLMLAKVLGLSFFEIFILYAVVVVIGWLIVRPRLFDKSVIMGHEDMGAASGVGYAVSGANVNAVNGERCIATQSKTKGFPRAVRGFFGAVLGNILQFFQRISGTVLVAAGVLYYLSHFGILDFFCGLIEPLFIPIGFSSAVIAVLVFGLLGKEMAVAAIVMLSPFVTNAEMMTFLVFFMLYPPCVASIKAIASQTGRHTAWQIVALKFAVAYVAAFVFYTFAILLG